MSLLRTLPLALAACILAGPARADLLPKDKPIPDVIDHYVETPWKDQKITPAPLADDATIIRRLTLDLNGRIPTSAEVEAYVSSKDAKKKEKLVDRLLSSPAFVRHQVNEFDVVFATEPMGRRNPGSNMRDYLTRAFKDNRSWDSIFRDVIVADEKEAAAKGASQYLKARVKDLDRLTNDVSVLFFGINVSCAQCHDHPLVRDWKQDHYYGMKSFFARSFEAGQFLGERDYVKVEFETTKREKKTAELMFLTGKKVDDPAMKLSPADRKKLEDAVKVNKKGKGDNNVSQPTAPKFSARAALADLVLQNDQRDFFAKAIVNRLWQRFHGHGLVNPIDQMHSENTPSHPELLDWLARDVAENKFDLKRLLRGMVLSRTYARSTQYEGERFPSMSSFAVARLRPMTPMQLATSLKLATTSPDRFPADLKSDELETRIEQTESSARGLAANFEQPRDDFQISVSEALLFSNSDRIQKELLTDGAQTLLGKMKEAKTPEQAIELAYRTAMSRAPSDEEKKAMLEHVGKKRDKTGEAYKQIVWALISSAEFRFNY